MRELIFLVSLPRSGNTLLSSILNQNKKIACTANSITFEILHRLNNIKEGTIFRNFPDYSSLDNVIKNVFNNYYRDWQQEIIIERSLATTPANLNYFKHTDHKFIFLERDTLEILCSFVALHIKNGDKRNPRDICVELLNENSPIKKAILAIETGKKVLNKDQYISITYDDLINASKETIDNIYDFIKLPEYNHRFENFEEFNVNGIRYNDSVLSFLTDCHSIRTSNISRNKDNIKDIIYNEIVDLFKNQG